MKYSVQAVIVTAALLVPFAASADTKHRIPRAQLVSVMTDTGQALVKDNNRGTYVVVRVGDAVQGFRVTSIQHDQIVLSRDKQHFVIPLQTKAKPKAPAKTRITMPTGVSRKRKLLLINPYPPKAKLTTVLAPPGLRFDPTQAARIAAKGAEKRRLKRIASLRTVVKPNRTKSRLRVALTIKRSEFDKAVSDFTTLAKEVQLKRDGKRILVSGIGRGSYFYRLGLRKGDRIISVDGKIIASMDDAAALYAGLMAASAFTVELERNKLLVTFRYSFDK